YARDANRPKSRKEARIGRFGDICPRQPGTVRTKVREGHEPADSAETGDFRLVQLGQKYAWDTKSRKSRERMESRH
ncbi:hypothetical protein KI387_030615, partial [Taxus chinensis]